LLVIAMLLLIPLGLRYLTSWHMGNMHSRLLREDADLRQLQERFTGLREDLIDTRRRLRQFQVRKDFLGNDIHRERQRLQELHNLRPTERIAA
jgi:hypothetical protein